MSTTLLLTHLQNANANVPLQTLSAALSHHLAADHITPTPLAAAAISSPFFLTHPPTNSNLQALVTAFQHAALLKHQSLAKTAEAGWSLSTAIFSKGVEGGMKEWVRDVLRGLQGGRPVLRLASCVGLLLGVHALRRVDANRGRVEDEVVIALAEVMDEYTADLGDWEKEFRPRVDESLLSLTLILASQSLPLIPTSKLNALPLSLLAALLTSTIASAFQHGNLLTSIPASSSPGKLHIPPDSPFAHNIQRTSTSPTMLAMPGLSKLTALVLDILVDKGQFHEAHSTLETFLTMASQVEHDYKQSNLATLPNEDELSPATKPLSQSLWLLLKTLLFSHIMIADRVLASTIYTPPVPAPQTQTQTPHAHAHTLAHTTLHTLAHLSFLLSQFGGVTAASDQQGFTELRKVFYLALDILISASRQDPEIGPRPRPGPNHGERFVRELLADLGPDRLSPENGKAAATDGDSLAQAKTAYVLACVEQLVPVLSAGYVCGEVWGFCVPYLTDPAHRDTYESAHSVVLAIFASHAHQAQALLPLGSLARPGQRHLDHHAEEEDEDGVIITTTTTTTGDRGALLGLTRFVRRVVPYYAQCLIENSEEGRLSTAQLRLAYAALVRSACSSSSGETYELGWYCIVLLLDTIRELSAAVAAAQGDRGEEERAPSRRERERLHRLHLTLISTVPSLPLPLLIHALDEIRSIVVGTARVAPSGGEYDRGGRNAGEDGDGDGDGEEKRRRKELVDAVFAEILERVGDREKEAAMRWWYANRDGFARSVAGVLDVREGGQRSLAGDDGRSDAVPRL